MARVKNSRKKGTVSKGERKSSQSTREKNPALRLQQKVEALKAGKTVAFTLETGNVNPVNPEKGSNRQFKRVKIDGKKRAIERMRSLEGV